MVNWFQFFLNYLKDPQGVAAIAPSSRFVAARVFKHIPSTTKTIVEYGPGNGAITIPLLDKMPTKCKLIAIEKNSDFVNSLKKITDTRLRVVHGFAQDCRKYCKKTDIILSALPFNAFPDKLRHHILAETAKNMGRNSKFIIYLQYTRVLRNYLPKYFKKIEHEFEWRNIPPAHLFICTKPRV